MEKDKPAASQKAFLEAQMKVIAAMVRGFLEKALKGHVGVLQLE